MAKQRISAIAFVLALPLLCGTAYAGDPSVDDILSALKPKANALTGTTRGIRPMRVITPTEETPVQGAAPRRHAAVIAPAPAASSEEGPSLDLTIGFLSGSTELTPQAAGTLAKLGKALSSPSLASYKFRIEGHTDTMGTKDGNQTLSQARAEKVASYLEHDYGVTADRLQAVGMGEDGLLVATPDQTAEPRNRRVHVVNLGG